VVVYLSLLGNKKLQSKRGHWCYRAAFLLEKYLKEKKLALVVIDVL